MSRSNSLYPLLKEESDRLESFLVCSQDLPRKVISKSWKGQEVEIDHHPFFLKNAATAYVDNAVTAYCFLRHNFPEIALSTLQKAFSSISHPGRLEIIQENPRVILSGDHNEAGVEGLVKTLQQLNAEKISILCGFSPDKKAKDMIEALKPFSKKLLLTEVPGARGIYSEDYCQLAEFEKDPNQALEKLILELDPQDTLLITGSLYLVGYLRARWKNEVAFTSN
jgi:dihydrofolate synthase/folylpolyglutamate synthase